MLCNPDGSMGLKSTTASSQITDTLSFGKHIKNNNNNNKKHFYIFYMWYFICYCFSITQFYLILWTCCSGLQHARAPCPSSSPRVFPSSSSRPLHQRCHQAILSSVTLFSFCPQSFIESGAFPMSRLFTSDYQNIGASVSASVLPMSVQGGFPLRLTGLISLLARDSQESSPAPEFKGTDSLVLCLLYSPALTAIPCPLGRP